MPFLQESSININYFIGVITVLAGVVSILWFALQNKDKRLQEKEKEHREDLKAQMEDLKEIIQQNIQSNADITKAVENNSKLVGDLPSQIHDKILGVIRRINKP